MKYGFVKLAAAIPSVRVADCTYNIQQIESLVAQAEGEGAEIICFPELCVTGYTCADLFTQQLLLDDAENAILQLLNFTRKLDIIVIVGLPLPTQNSLLNAALVIQHGKILGAQTKTYLPNSKEFYEKRWFATSDDDFTTDIHLCGQHFPVGNKLLFSTSTFTFGIEICEDVWAPIPPSSYLTMDGADIIFNLSASNELIDKHSYLLNLLSQQSARCICGYIYASAGFGESTQDVVYGGNALMFENGTQIAKSERFSFKEQLITSEIDIEKLRTERRMNTTFATNEGLIDPPEITMVKTDTITPKEYKLTRKIDTRPFVPKGQTLNERCEEILNIQVAGLAKRLVHTHCEKAVIGISGGLDSTLALLVTVKAFDKLGISRKGIIGITMPGFGTTDHTHTNAVNLMGYLGVTKREINIREACIRHFKDIDHDINVHDVTYENAQARERTQILMDIANQESGLVIGTGDLSELALGWATYNGDHMSMYGVNVSIPKTLVKHLVTWVANTMEGEAKETLISIVNTPISPELTPADENGNIQQKTEDLVGPYELHDFFLYHFLRFGFRPAKIYYLARHAFGELSNHPYDEQIIKKWLTTFCRRFFAQQFKRSCLPDGPKVGSCSLSPRGDWRMPSDAYSEAWILECESL